MTDEPSKKPEQPEGPKPTERTKVTETAKDPDQTEKFRAIRRELAKSELAFSVNTLLKPGERKPENKFELVDGDVRIAAATPAADTRQTPTAADMRPNGPASTVTGDHPTITVAPAKPVDLNEALRDAEAIRKATGNDNAIFRWADRDAINKILEGKTEAERKAIGDIYQQKYGHTLEQEMKGFETGSDLDKFLNILHRSDTNAENQGARRLHEDLLERHNTIEGRSNSQIDKDIRELLSTRNSDQIAKMDQQYKQTYGVSLKDAIADDDRIPQSTKDAVAIYLKGNDKRTDQDTAQLISTSLKEQNTELFAEAMRDASPTARKAFLDNGGEQKVNDAFHHWYSNSDVQHAMDYAREGKLSASTQIADNTGLVFDNAKGIELALQRMTDQERKMYVDGKTLASGKPLGGLSADDQKKAQDYYKTMHDALSKTANATEMVKYEDMIANKGDGSLIASLAKNRGMIYNSSTEDITNDIRNMSPAQFDDLKKHPERRVELEQMLKSLNKGDSDVKQVLAVYDKMLAAPDLEHATEVAKPSVTQEIASSHHWYGTNQLQLMDSISNMSAADQNRYRTDEKFREQIVQSINSGFESPRSLDAAQRMLQQVKEGKAPDSDPIAILERTPNYDGNKTGDIARQLDAAFNHDPALRDRITNPRTDADRQFAELFKKTAQQTFGDDYERFGKPLAETGRLPLEEKVGLNKGLISNDYKQAFDDLQHATPEEKKRLQDDPSYREKVIGFMDQNRQQIALATLNQTELKPEDNIRAAAVGWGGSSDIVAELKNIKPEELSAVKTEYARKYGSSLEGDLMHKLGGEDKEVAERVLAQNTNAETRTNISREQTENARSGIGASLSDHVFRSGTGTQADDAVNQTDRAIAEQNRMTAAISSGIARNMTPEQIQQLQTRLSAQVDQQLRFQDTATTNAVDSKKAAANYVADGAIMTAAIGSMVLTGGADAPLVIGLAVAGAGIKVGANAAIQGNNYDWSVGQVATDATIGSVTAATAVIGPGEIAAVFGIGRTAAAEATGLAIAETGEQLLAQGGKSALENGTKDIVQNALASGARKLNPAEFETLANKVIAPELTGAVREQAVKKLAESLEKNVAKQIASGVVKHATHYGLNAGGGAAAGGVSGGVEGTTEWDSRKSTTENLAHIAGRTGEGAAGGAIAGAGITGVMHAGGTALRAVRGEAESTAAGAARSLNAEGSPRPSVMREALEAPPKPTEGPPKPSEAPAKPPEVLEVPPRPTQAPTEAPLKSSPEGGTEHLTTSRPNPLGTERTTATRPGSEGERTVAPKLAPEGTEVRPKPAVESDVKPPADSSRWSVNERGQLLDSKGNILERDWPKVEPNKIEAVRAQVRTELAQVKASDGGSVLDKLNHSNLSDAQKTRILDALGEVREHYAKTFKTDSDQVVNWIHTQGELGRVLDAAKGSGLTPAQTEDAMLASMFSDSLKTRANFTTHHLDGELAAERILKEKLGGDFTPERLNGILHAIREHQIAPPAFMAMIYEGAIKRSIGAEGRQLTEAETGDLASLIKKMRDPFNSAQVDAPGGGKMLQLSDEERALLKRTGTDNWYVPNEGTAWNKISRALIDGDGMDNYATPGGLSKIIQIRGPETGPFFKDGNFRYENPDRVPGKPPSSSQESWRDSFNDFAKVASPDGLAVARAAASDAEKSAVNAQGRVDAWLHEKLGIPSDQELPTIPGWTGKPKLDAAGKPHLDANGRPVMQPDNLKYPDYEQKWWDVHNKPAAARTAEEKAYYEDPANRYRGLNEQEIKQFKLAQEIRDRYAVELRKEQRVAGDAAPDYKPVEATLNRRVNDRGQILDSKGNVLESEWPKVDQKNVEAVREQVRTELAQVKASDGSSVLDKLNKSNLSDAQKTRVLDALGEVREHYGRTFKSDSDQVVNWIHTQGELGRVLDSTVSAKLTPTQTEDALLASMFSDSLKTKANFHTHHIDGELAAERILKDKLGGDFTQERLDGILHAIREHQIAPPVFMSGMYAGAIRRSIGAEKRALTEAETTSLNSLTKKMSEPFKSPLVDAPDGGKMLLLTDDERALLKRTGTDNWYVPSEGTAWNKISRALIDGDGIDNYGTPGGLSKIIQIRGPETFPNFKDGNLRYENPGRGPNQPPSSSQESWRDSFADFATVASPEGASVARAAAAESEKAAVTAQARVDVWLHERLGIPADQPLPTIPGWTCKPKLDAASKPILDANGPAVMVPDNLKYPDYEQKWWDIHLKPAGQRTAEDKAFYEDPANRYRGLNEQEIQQFKLVQEIRSRYVAELRKEQRVKGDAAPDYQPVVPPG